MMSTTENQLHDRICRLMKEIKYKDWELLYSIIDGGALIRWRFNVDGHHWSTRKWYVSQHATDSEIVQTALKAVLTAEEHEAREHFLYRGRTIFGPHHHVDSLLNLSQDVRTNLVDDPTNHEAFPSGPASVSAGCKEAYIFDSHVPVESIQTLGAFIDPLESMEMNPTKLIKLFSDLDFHGHCCPDFHIAMGEINKGLSTLKKLREHLEDIVRESSQDSRQQQKS